MDDPFIGLLGLAVTVAGIWLSCYTYLRTREAPQWRIEHVEDNRFKITRLGLRGAVLIGIEILHDGRAESWASESGEPRGILFRRGDSDSFDFNQLPFSVRGREAIVYYSFGRYGAERTQHVNL